MLETVRLEFFDHDTPLNAYIYGFVPRGFFSCITQHRSQPSVPKPSTNTNPFKIKLSSKHLYSIHTSRSIINTTTIIMSRYSTVTIAPKKRSGLSRGFSRGDGGYTYTNTVTETTIAHGCGLMVHTRDEHTHINSGPSSGCGSHRVITEDDYESDSDISDISSDEELSRGFHKLKLGGRGTVSRAGGSFSRMPRIEELRDSDVGTSGSRSRASTSTMPGSRIEEIRYADVGNTSSRHSGSQRAISQHPSSRDSGSRHPSSRDSGSRHPSSRPSESHSHHHSSRPSESRSHRHSSRPSESRSHATPNGELMLYDKNSSRRDHSSSSRPSESRSHATPNGELMLYDRDHSSDSRPSGSHHSRSRFSESRMTSNGELVRYEEDSSRRGHSTNKHESRSGRHDSRSSMSMMGGSKALIRRE